MLGQPTLVSGQTADLRFEYETGSSGLARGSRLRIGLPNTGWDRPVVPQQRYWDELVCGSERRLAPFHPVNTTARVIHDPAVPISLEVMERMLLPDEDPAFAYWRWWITLRLEGEALEPGQKIEVLYGDQRFGAEAKIQRFAEDRINVTAYIQSGGQGAFRAIEGSPFFIDVIPGPAERANVVRPSVHSGSPITARVALTDGTQCSPRGGASARLTLDSETHVCEPGIPREFSAPDAADWALRGESGGIWGTLNPSVPLGPDGLSLYWGDLHAQSEHHVMHSQKKDFRQSGWSKGISSGTLDECYWYARNVSLLDFVAMTDQGACLTEKWEYCQEKVRSHHEDGRFVVFKGYEAGSPLGHRNVIYATDGIDPPLDAKRFNTFHPEAVYERYRKRGDAILIPHHVKTWTDWKFHDPELEPLMEIYSAWGQSESPGLDLWNKGQTPGAGAWEAFRLGYRMGMMASSDNHVGMPGRSHPGDRQVHTPFPGGLCAVWAPELARESLFESLTKRRCYGTTGARIIVRFTVDGAAMGSILRRSGDFRLRIEVYGTAPVERVEIVRNLGLWRVLRPSGDPLRLLEEIDGIADESAFYYLRVFQTDGQRAWTSPIWID